MAFDAHKNFAYSLVATAPSPAASGTELIVTGGEGTKFPATPFNATVWPINSQPDTGNAEIVRVTNVDTDTFTITREQESTSARTVIIGDQIAATITALSLTDVEDGSTIYNSLMEGRLSLTTAVPVTTADVTAAGSIYYVPYIGDKIVLYSGSIWVPHTFPELDLALTATVNKPYDVFIYDNSGTPTLETLVWTDDTNRATALAYQDGVLCKSGALTRRYVGSFYAEGTDETEDSEAKRMLWNYYNRVDRPMRAVEATDSWNYTTATIRQANASVANQLEFIIGVSEDSVNATASASSNQTNGDVQRTVGIGLDSTVAFATGSLTGTDGDDKRHTTRASYTGFPGIGAHRLTWLEHSVATGTTTWYGDDGGAISLSGINGTVLG